MLSGESHALTTLNLQPGVANPVRVSLVYPADATPGHLLSVVPATQLATVQQRQLRGSATRPATAVAPTPKTALTTPTSPPPRAAVASPNPLMAPAPIRPPASLPSRPPIQSSGVNAQQLDRYQEAIDAQREMMHKLMDR